MSRRVHVPVPDVGEASRPSALVRKRPVLPGLTYRERAAQGIRPLQGRG